MSCRKIVVALLALCAVGWHGPRAEAQNACIPGSWKWVGGCAWKQVQICGPRGNCGMFWRYICTPGHWEWSDPSGNPMPLLSGQMSLVPRAMVLSKGYIYTNYIGMTVGNSSMGYPRVGGPAEPLAWWNTSQYFLNVSFDNPNIRFAETGTNVAVFPLSRSGKPSIGPGEAAGLSFLARVDSVVPAGTQVTLRASVTTSAHPYCVNVPAFSTTLKVIDMF